ncbi:MAG: ABC transporter permease [Verrucomicrobia bacterium]|nr:MAG: ABC transporter permease [Verrucomicrobiota bacterium]
MTVVIRLAWRNLWRHRRRTWLTIGSMVFSNILLVFMISLQLGSYRMMIDNSLRAFTGHFQIQAPGYNEDPKLRLTVPSAIEASARLRNELELDGVAARGIGFALLSSDERSYGVQIVGTEPGHEASVSTLPGLMLEGRYFTDSRADEIVIGSVLARNLKIGVGDELTLLGSGKDGSFAAAVPTVTGIFESGMIDLDRGMAQMPLGTFQDVFAMGDAANSIVVVTPDVTALSVWQPGFDAFLADNPDLVLVDWVHLQPGLREAIQADMSSAWFMYGVLIILVAFSVLNTQLMSVMERTREFGTILALGLRPGRLSLLVMVESAFMAAIGLIIGILLGVAISLYYQKVGFAYPGMGEMADKFNLPDRMYPSLSALSILLGPMVVYLGCLAAALYPALRLRRLEPFEAMRAV